MGRVLSPTTRSSCVEEYFEWVEPVCCLVVGGPDKGALCESYRYHQDWTRGRAATCSGCECRFKLRSTFAKHAQTLSVFLSCLLSKRYSHPSSDIMVVLAGIDYIDIVFTDFVGALEGIVRNGKSCREPSLNSTAGADPRPVEIRHRAVEVLLAVTSGAYQTTLLTYLIQRDLFPSVMKVLEERLLSKSALTRCSLSKTPSQPAKPWNRSYLSASWPTTISLSFKIRINSV